MKTYLIFNPEHKPDNMGASHIIENMDQWLLDRKGILVNAKISEDIAQLTFGDNDEYYANLYQVSDDSTYESLINYKNK